MPAMKPCGDGASEVPERFRWIVRALFVGCMVFSYLANRAGLVSDHSVCRAMVNNAFLAYLPVELSFHVSGKRRTPVFWGLVAAWMLFYPNAPYVLTDFFHLAYIDPYVVRENGKITRIIRPDLRLWLTFTVLSLCAMVSAIFGAWSLDHVVGRLQERIRRTGLAWQVPLVVAFAALSSAGIYLGRFPRLHSIHLLTRPYHALEKMATACSLNMFEFVVMLTLIQVVVWGALKVLRTLPPCRSPVP